jgi:hypothetical protein
MSLTIILATRNRPELLTETVERTLPNMVYADTKLVIAIDHDDEKTIKAAAKFTDERVIPDVRKREDSLGEKYNNRMAVCPADVYLAMVDYAPHIIMGFDAKIQDAAQQFPDRIGAVTNRLANLSFPEINAVTHDMAKLMGGMYPGVFPYWFVDHWFGDIAQMVGRDFVADVQIDTKKRPGTMEMREPAFWGTVYDVMAPERRRIASRILAVTRDEPWRKQMLMSAWPRIEQRSKWINDQVRSMGSALVAQDERYLRARAVGAAILRTRLAELEAQAVAA